MSSKRRFRFGPGALVTAAFIGPGTITTCSLAGADFGFALLWGLVFSVLATIVLQEMAARLGIITQQGLGEALRKEFAAPLPRFMTALLVISAITIGNAAFETGNIIGASLGLKGLFNVPRLSVNFWAAVTGTASFILLLAGSYKLLERVLIGLVIIMSLTFLTTAVIIGPQLLPLLKGMFVPKLPAGSIVTLIGLIGTTVVPYNLFLHASAVRERWDSHEDLPEARLDISVSVILGGLISMAIVVTSAVAFYGTGSSVTGAADLGKQLEPLLGSTAKYFVSGGLFAAGISSAITAPLAAAYATSGILGWKRDLTSWRFRSVWMFILITGVVFSMAGFKPLEAIVFAQAANGILLPIIAIYLLYVMNSRKIMGTSINTTLSNIAGIIVVLVALSLGLRTILHIFGVI
jgi:NRAMP (natural resistance-associated macrophage protein)-like metal ion transporter